MGESDELKALMADRVSESQVADLLNKIASPPNLRDEPVAGDLTGRFDQWFDGGALCHDTGSTRYQFHDGTKAVVGVTSWLSVIFWFSGGRMVRLEQVRH